MPTTKQALRRQLARVPCRRCTRSSAFLDEADLCPFCRGRDLEAAHDLRPGLFRELVARIDIAPELRPRRAVRLGRRSGVATRIG